MTRRNQVSDRLHPPPAQPMMRKEPYASHLSLRFPPVPFIFLLSRFIWFPSVSSPSPYVTHVTRLRSSFVPQASGTNRREPKVRGARQGTDDWRGLVSLCRPRFRPFPPSLSSLRRSVPHALVRSSRRSLIPHFLRIRRDGRMTGRSEWKGTEDDRSPATRLSLSVGSYLPTHPRRRRVALTSLAPVSDGNGNNMRE